MRADDFTARVLDCQARMVAGDHTGITELHRRLRGGLHAYFLRRLGGSSSAQSDTADELAQRAWIEFWKALAGGRYDPARAKPSTFLYAIAANILLRHRREQGRERSRTVPGAEQHLDEAAADEFDDPSHLAEALELVRRVVRGDEPDSGLGDQDRQVLRWIAEGRSEREIAGYLELAPSTAHERRRSILGRLSAFLMRRGCISNNLRATQPLRREEEESR